jgi:hypothetical protein
MKLIGLHGRLSSGKDTAFDFLANNDPGLNFKRVAFADKLKISAMAALGYDSDKCSDEDVLADAGVLKARGEIAVYLDGEFEVSFTGREYLQWYGAEAHRDLFGEYFWVNALLPKPGPFLTQESNDKLLCHHYPYTDVLVVTDVRFDNEATRILALGGEVWWIDAEQRLGSNTDKHASEAKLPDSLISRRIDNNGSLSDFESNLKAAYTC